MFKCVMFLSLFVGFTSVSNAECPWQTKTNCVPVCQPVATCQPVCQPVVVSTCQTQPVHVYQPVITSRPIFQQPIRTIASVPVQAVKNFVVAPVTTVVEKVKEKRCNSERCSLN